MLRAWEAASVVLLVGIEGVYAERRVALARVRELEALALLR